jgi:hypothetical protein
MTTPTLVKNDHVRADGRVFVENVEFQELKPHESVPVIVAITVKKCAASKCELLQERSGHEEKYTVQLCAVPIDS